MQELKNYFGLGAPAFERANRAVSADALNVEDIVAELLPVAAGHVHDVIRRLWRRRIGFPPAVDASRSWVKHRNPLPVAELPLWFVSTRVAMAR
jgi:hypothetical protein